MKPTQEQVIAWAREVCMPFYYQTGEIAGLERLEQFANLAYAAGASDEREACAKVVGQQWVSYKELEAAHYRHTPEPFNPFNYHKDLSTIFFSRDMAGTIRARGES